MFLIFGFLQDKTTTTGLSPMTPFLKALASLHTQHRFLSVLAAALAGALVLGGCAAGPEASRTDTEQIQSLDEVAVVSIRSKKLYQNRIAEKSLDNTEDVREAVSTITEVTERQERRADPNYQAASEQVHNYLFGSFRLTAPFSLLEEESILQSPDYQTAGEQDNDWRKSLFATPTGYRSLDPAQLRKEASLKTLISQLPAAPDGILFAETTYSVVTDEVRQAKRKTWESPLQDGTFSRSALSKGDTVHVDVEATVRIHVLDRRGSTALEIEQTARSGDGFTFVYGEGWHADQINGATQQAIQTALGRITNRLQNKLPNDVLAQTSSVLPESETSDLNCTCSQ